MIKNRNYLKNKIIRTEKILRGMTYFEIAEVLVRGGVYIVPKDKERMKLTELEREFIIDKKTIGKKVWD